MPPPRICAILPRRFRDAQTHHFGRPQAHRSSATAPGTGKASFAATMDALPIPPALAAFLDTLPIPPVLQNFLAAFEAQGVPIPGAILIVVLAILLLLWILTKALFSGRAVHILN